MPWLDLEYQMKLLVDSLLAGGVTLDESEVQVLGLAEVAPAGTLEGEFYASILYDVCWRGMFPHSYSQRLKVTDLRFPDSNVWPRGGRYR